MKFSDNVSKHNAYRSAMRGLPNSMYAPRCRSQRAFPVVRVMLFIILLAFALLYGRAHAASGYEDPAWAQHTAMPRTEYAFDVALLADMLTTLDIKHHPELEEGNPLLPRHPSDGNVVAFFVGVGIVHALITHAMIAQGMDSRWVTAWEYVSIGFEGGAAAYNLHAGLRFAL